MAGVKGRSGGARQGAGRKPKAGAGAALPADRAAAGQGRAGSAGGRKQGAVPQGDKDMLQLLQDVALGRTEATSLQVRAAIAAVQYTHTKKHDGGKKDEAADKAKRVSAGKFVAASPPPRLVVSNK